MTQGKIVILDREEAKIVAGILAINGYPVDVFDTSDTVTEMAYSIYYEIPEEEQEE